MPGKAVSYRVSNWSKYNRSLIERGNITVWFSDDALSGWQSSKEHEGRGRPEKFSDAAIECCLLLRSIYHLPLRATQGFIQGLVGLLGLEIDTPDYTLLCKRASKLSIDLKMLTTSTPIDIVVDSTGLKVYGEGEWKVRCHGKSKPRSWRKLHLAVNPKSHEIIGCELTDHKTHDCEVIDNILPQQELGNVCADGAYDNEKSYAAISQRSGTPFIPPRSGACKTEKPSLAMALRNHTIQACWAMGRDNWKKGSVYHQRSLAETAMFRFKTITSGNLASRKFSNQKAEVRLKSQILNRMSQLGMSQSYKVA